MMLPSTDSALLASLSAPALALECLRRWRLYLNGGRTYDGYRALVWASYECKERGIISAFDCAEAEAKAEYAESVRMQWRWHTELLERTPKKGGSGT